MSEEEPCPKVRKVDHGVLHDPIYDCSSTGLSDVSDASNHTLNR